MVFCDGRLVYPDNRIITEQDKLRLLHYLRESPNRLSVFELVNVAGVKLWQARELLEPYVEQGLIRQDRRDRWGPFDESATYYTVPEKRDEIDRRLREYIHEARYKGDVARLAHVEDGEKIKACFECMEYYQSFITDCPVCWRRTDDLDARIAEAIFMLNRKGYKTVSCCAGHGSGMHDAHIVFEENLAGIQPPANFWWEKANILSNIPYHKIIGISRKKCEETVDSATIIKYREESLQELRKWIKGLPVR